MSAARTLSERADEYVLGLLDPHEAEAVEAEIERDPAMAKAVVRSRRVKRVMFFSWL